MPWWHRVGEGEGRDIVPIHILGTKKEVCGQPHAPVALLLGGIQYSLYKKLGGPQSCSGEHGKSCLHQGSHYPTCSKLLLWVCSPNCPFVQLSRIFIQSYSIGHVTGQHFCTVEPWVQSHSSPYGICVGQSGTASDFCLSTVASDCTTDVILPLMHHTHLLFRY
jgi:hypothetical protein